MKKLNYKSYMELTHHRLGNGMEDTAVIKKPAYAKIKLEAQKSPVMTDDECRAYFQLVYCAETERAILWLEKKKLGHIISQKGLEDDSSSEEAKKYKENELALRENAKACADLYKNALSRNPSDEQLRFICAASVYAHHHDNYYRLGSLDVLRDKDIAKDMTKSKRLIDAMIHYDMYDKRKNFDSEMLFALIDKNFQVDTIMSHVTKDISQHPSWFRGCDLFDMLAKYSKNDFILADNAFRYLNGSFIRDRKDMMKAVFEHRSALAASYLNFEKSYMAAYKKEKGKEFDAAYAKERVESSEMHQALGNSGVEAQRVFPAKDNRSL